MINQEAFQASRRMEAFQPEVSMAGVIRESLLEEEEGLDIVLGYN